MNAKALTERVERFPKTSINQGILHDNLSLKYATGQATPDREETGRAVAMVNPSSAVGKLKTNEVRQL
jgi:hypothetical protein